MAITTSGTTLTFNDATTQTTAPVNTNANVTSATAVAGTGISVTAVTTTGAATHTVTNTGVTSVAAGTGISVSASTGGVTITNTQTPSTGTVTSVATGNGLSGGTITTSGTLTIACPSFNSVGSYAQGTTNSAGISAGSSIAPPYLNATCFTGTANILSGTWRWMGSTTNACGGSAVVCRIA